MQFPFVACCGMRQLRVGRRRTRRRLTWGRRMPSSLWGVHLIALSTPIDQRRVDVSTGISKFSCNEMCVSVRRSVYWVCRCSVLQRWARALFRPTPPVYYCTAHLYSKWLVYVLGVVSVADHVAARVISRERRGRIVSKFHIVESMPKSVSKSIGRTHLVHGLLLQLVYF